MSENKLTGYELSRDFFDWCFENPELIKPVHIAIYMFAIEHCNRLGWKSKFGFPTQMTMDAIGIKNWRTYIKAFNELCDWGFFKLHEKSKNQYSANVIAIVKNTKAGTKAQQKHSQKHSNSIVGINKLYNNITIETIEQKSTKSLNEKLKTYSEHLFKQSVCERLGMNLCIKPEHIKTVISEFIETCYGEIILKDNVYTVESYFIHWFRAKPNRLNESLENQAKKRNHERQSQAK